MIPDRWTSVTRPSDGERCGYLEPLGSGLVRPMSLIGEPLGGPDDPASAARLVIEAGLLALDSRWWMLLPSDLTGQSGRDPETGRPAVEWRAVVLVEASPAEVRFRLAAADPSEAGFPIVSSNPPKGLAPGDRPAPPRRPTTRMVGQRPAEEDHRGSSVRERKP